MFRRASILLRCETRYYLCSYDFKGNGKEAISNSWNFFMHGSGDEWTMEEIVNKWIVEEWESSL